jgi:hypothetical protein
VPGAPGRESTLVYGVSSSSESDEKEEEKERVELNKVSEGGSTKEPCGRCSMVTTDSCAPFQAETPEKIAPFWDDRLGLLIRDPEKVSF